ncbi:MAG: hypothetical protein J1F60_08565 [Oscillospiraceae bacterium]|nr:hypothetical protein [Oscillospiraceae bacterium]
MYGVNNVNHSPFNYGKNSHTPAQNDQHKGVDEKVQGRKDEILFSSVSRKDESYLSSLSKEAKDYLAKLKEMYPDYDFIIADYETDEEASELLSKGKGEMNVLITPDLLEKMATDEATRAKYEDIIAGAKDQFEEINENLTEGGKSLVKSLGITVNADGTVNFFANLIDGIRFGEEGSTTLKSSLISDLTKTLNDMAEARAKMEEHIKAQREGEPDNSGPMDLPFTDAADKHHGHGPKDTKVHSNANESASDLGKAELERPDPKKMQEILDRISAQIKVINHGKFHPIHNLRPAEPEHHHGKKDHGNLPPESFKKYEKEKTIYDRKKEPGNLPPESFKKFEKEKTIYDREDEPSNIPPESFEKYRDEDMNFKV